MKAEDNNSLNHGNFWNIDNDEICSVRVKQQEEENSTKGYEWICYEMKRRYYINHNTLITMEHGSPYKSQISVCVQPVLTHLIAELCPRCVASVAFATEHPVWYLVSPPEVSLSVVFCFLLMTLCIPQSLSSVNNPPCTRRPAASCRTELDWDDFMRGREKKPVKEKHR